MTDFPWAAVVTAVSATVLALIPVLLGLSANARYERTLRMLKTTVEVHAGSSAEKSLRDSLDLMAARKMSKLENGSGIYFYLLAVAMSTILIARSTGALELNDFNIGLTSVSAIVFLGVYFWRYYVYASAVQKALTK